MAQKRMFDRSIIETDNFLNVSLTAKALYFLLGMEADDEGFVSPQRIVRIYGGEIGDIKNLIDVGLIIPFKSGVVVITDWKQNNWLDNRRIKPTQYQNEKKMLSLTSNGKYMLSNGLALAQPEEKRREQKRGEESGAFASQKTPDLGDGSGIEKDDTQKSTAELAREAVITRKGYDPALVRQLVEWAETIMEHEFTNKPKQRVSISKMLSTGFSFAQIQDKWLDMSKHKFWGNEGFDFSNVANEIGKFKGYVRKGPQVIHIGKK